MSIPQDRQRLIFRGKLLSNEDTLSSHKIEDGSVVHLVANPTPAQEQQPTVEQPPRNPATQIIADTAELAIITSLLRTISN